MTIPNQNWSGNIQLSFDNRKIATTQSLKLLGVPYTISLNDSPTKDWHSDWSRNVQDWWMMNEIDAYLDFLKSEL
jgi:hypothetical protein